MLFLIKTERGFLRYTFKSCRVLPIRVSEVLVPMPVGHDRMAPPSQFPHVCRLTLFIKRVGVAVFVDLGRRVG